MNILKRIFQRGQSGSSEAFAEKQEQSIGMDAKMLEELALYSVRRGLFGLTGILNFNPDDLAGRKGLDIYTQMYRRDDMVRNASNMKVMARLSGAYRIEPADEKIEPRAKEQADFCEYMIEQMHGEFYESLRQIYTAHRYGFSVTEIIAMIYKTGPFKGKIGLDRLKTRDPVDFDFDVDKHGNLLTQAKDGRDGLIQGYTSGLGMGLPPWKFIIYTHMGDFGNWYGESDYRPCYRNYFSKDAIIKFWNVALERYGMPTVYAQILQDLNYGDDEEENPNGISEATKRRIVQALKNLQTGTAAFLPAGVDIKKIEEMKGRAAFQEALTYHDRCIARAILMPSLLTEEGQRSGGLALGRAHFDTFQMVIEQMGRTGEDVINEQLLRRMIDLNWADTQEYPGLKFTPLSQDRLEKFGARVKTATEIGIIRPEDEVWIREGMEFPPAVEAEPKPKALPPSPEPEKAADAHPVRDFLIRKFESEPADVLNFDAATEAGQESIREYLLTAVVPFLSGQSQPGDWPREEGLRSYVQCIEGEAAKARRSPATAQVADPKDLNVRTYPRTLNAVEKRPDYQGIQKFWRELTETTVDKLKTAMTRIKQDTMTKTARVLADGNPSAIDRLILSPAGFTEFRKIMQDFYTLDFVKGAREAAKEVEKGIGKKIDFSDAWWDFANDLSPVEAVDFMRDKTPVLRRQLAVYDRRAFTITGVEQQRILAEVKRTMQTGVARGSSVREIMAQIEAIFTKYGIGGELISANRLETIVRTNLSEAFNTARMGAFADPSLAQFIEAYEYIAIIDPRTTEFCESYDGFTRSALDPIWGTIWPPNHFNCRSIVVAVVTGDTWERTAAAPGIAPADGFQL